MATLVDEESAATRVDHQDCNRSSDTDGAAATRNNVHQRMPAASANKNNNNNMEWVLAIPPRLTQVAYAILVQAHCVPRPWHLEGRHGSRTHKLHVTDDNNSKDTTDNRMCIPILAAAKVKAAAETNSALRDLLDTTDEQGNRSVEMVYKQYTVSNRAHEPPPFDARIHPERAPAKIPAPLLALGSNECPPTPTTAATTAAAAAFTYAELFAGIGGFGVALEALGGTCVFCSELEESCREIYAANFLRVGDNRLLHGDIYNVADSDLPASLDLLVGGFPCQPFSALGEQPGFDCPKGHLFLEIVRVLNASKPTAFLLENVPGLLQMPETLHTIVHALEGAGYAVTMQVCDARGLTATSRKRLYFVGLLLHPTGNNNNNNNDCSSSNKEDNDDDSPTVVAPSTFAFPYVPDLGLRARDVIQYETTTRSSSSIAAAAEDALLRVTDLQLQRLNAEKYWRPAHLAWPNGTVRTLVSHYGTCVARGHSQLVPAFAANADATLTPCSTNPRRFTPRECARIMGFPESFVLQPTTAAERRRVSSKDGPSAQGAMARTKELYRMLGNAVCPPMIAAIAGAVLDRCPGIHGYKEHSDWVEWGRSTAVRLAYEATLAKA